MQKMRAAQKELKNKQIRRIEDLIAPLWQDMANEDREILCVVWLDDDLCVLDVDVPEQMRDVDGVYTSLDSILTRGQKMGARYAINAHNHPNSLPQPSLSDINTTQRFYDVFKAHAVHLLDSLILSRYGFVSMKGMGLL